MTVINLALVGGAIWCAAVLGWAAIGTNDDRPRHHHHDED